MIGDFQSEILTISERFGLKVKDRNCEIFYSFDRKQDIGFFSPYVDILMSACPIGIKISMSVFFFYHCIGNPVYSYT